MVEEETVNQSQQPEEGVEGSPAEHRLWVVVAEEGGCPLQVEAEGSWLAGVDEGGQVSKNSWQPKEAVEEGGMGPEVVAEGSLPMVEVEVGHVRSP